MTPLGLPKVLRLHTVFGNIYFKKTKSDWISPFFYSGLTGIPTTDTPLRRTLVQSLKPERSTMDYKSKLNIGFMITALCML